MRPTPFVLLICLLALLGCGDFPQVEARAVTGPAPQLVPIEGVIAKAALGGANVGARDALAGRAAGLRARAGAMRGPVHSPETRARLAKAVAAHPALIGG